MRKSTWRRAEEAEIETSLSHTRKRRRQIKRKLDWPRARTKEIPTTGAPSMTIVTFRIPAPARVRAKIGGRTLYSLRDTLAECCEALSSRPTSPRIEEKEGGKKRGECSAENT